MERTVRRLPGTAAGPAIRISDLTRARLARRLVAWLVLAMALILGAMSFQFFRADKARIERELLASLRSLADHRAREASVLFRMAEDNTYQLRDEFLRRLVKVGDADPKREFDAWFSRWPDGLVRVKPALDDHTRLPSVYLRASVPLDARVHRLTLTAFDLLREWGPIMTVRFYSAYIDLPGEGLIMYSPSVNWGAEATPETNNFDYPPVQNAGPELNVTRRNNWTDVYFDDKAGIYMVSTVTPIDLDGAWIGAASQDVSIHELLDRTLNERMPGTFNLIVSRDGHLIAHPAFGKKIRDGGGSTRVADLHDALLDEVMSEVRTFDGAPRSRDLGDGAWQVGMARIDGPGWIFVTVHPGGLLRAEALSTAIRVMTWGGLGMAALISLTYLIVSLGVSQPLRQLRGAVRSIAQGDRSRQVNVRRDDELGDLGRAFNQMVLELDCHERQLQDANATLETRVAERTEALRSANRDLEQSVIRLEQMRLDLLQADRLAALGSLVAGVAHELNTPVGNALLIATTMDDNVAEFAKAVAAGNLRRTTLDVHVEESRNALVILLRCLRSVADLVASFKQVAVDRASEMRRSFDLAQVVHDVLATLRPMINRTSHHIEVEVPDGLMLNSYPGALGQVLSNFVNNAIVHGFDQRSGGTMRLTATCASEGWVTLRFSDDGAGMQADVLPRVFDPFFTTRLGQGGSGLGLHVTYTLVTDLLGGRIAVTSEPGKGSEFVVTLPVNAPVS